MVDARVRALLPTAPSRVLVHGDAELESSVAAAGHTLVERVACATAGSVDAAIFAVDDDGIEEATLVALHAVLPARGSLIVSALETARRGLVVALSQSAFVVVTVEAEGDRVLIHARRDDFVVRSYRDRDAPAILALFHRVFHPHRELEHLRWKYLEAPYGNRRISLAFDAQGGLMAHYAGYPVPLHDALARSPRDVLVHHVGDTMTAPEARSVGRGETSLLGRTVRHFYAAYCEDQVAFNYGFNRGNIQKFSLRFVRAARAEDVGFRARDLAARPLARRARWRAVWDGLGVGEVASPEAIGAEWDALFERVAPAYGLLVRRDSEYLRWRYLACPDTHYRILAVRRRGRLIGWGVFRLDRETLIWGDALFEPAADHAVASLLAAAVEAAGGTVRRIEGWFPDRPQWWSATLDRAGFAREPQPQELALMMVPFDDPALARSLAARLYYTQGDSDLF